MQYDPIKQSLGNVFNKTPLARINIKAPKPIIFISNVLVIEYIGDSERPAPLMKDVKLKNPKEIFETLIDYVSKMYKKADLVHSDISAFNVLMFEDKPYLIDLGQGVLIEHPNALGYLRRDISNLVSYFNKFGIRADANKIFDKITKKK